ncbi:nucleotidyltransferase, partial [Myxococcota bacterium]|nr:nucleotidyltransferase [Myxococcota bacterium]
AGSFVTERILLSMADHVFLGDAVPVMCQQSADSDHSLLLIDRNLGEIFDMDDATKVLTDAHGAILDIGKEIPEYNAVDTGLFCITPSLVEALSRLESPTLSEGVKLLASRGLMGTVELTGGTWQDIDTPETLAHALTLLDQEK